MAKKKISEELQNAFSFFLKNVSNYYLEHERTFDLESFHGRFHILRCLCLADSIINKYKENAININVEKTFYAIMFHDSCRKDNGVDLWEEESKQLCKRELISINKTDIYAEETANLILKPIPFSIEGQILYDVDVLDYHRFFWIPEEQNCFDNNKLLFCSYNDTVQLFNTSDRKAIIQLARDLVRETQSVPIKISTCQLIELITQLYLKYQPW